MMANSNAESKRSTPYNERSDLEKIQSQWVKLTGLHDRTDYSAAVVRAATAAEIAVNFAIRKEFSGQSQLDEKFIDSLLVWANSLRGKIDRLLLPITSGNEKYDKIQALAPLAKKINKKRNEIAHSGHFSNKKETAELLNDCKTFVQGIVQIYDAGFKLKPKKIRAKKGTSSTHRKATEQPR